MITVYHNSKFTACSFGGDIAPDSVLTKVAEVDTDDLDEAYRLTNNIDQSWTLNEGVSSVAPELRSTSVGDVLLSNGEYLMVDTFGFKKLSAEDLKKFKSIQ